MLTTEFIAQKRDNHELADADIAMFIRGVTDQSVSDAQIAAFAMATLLRGMTSAEEVALTRAMRDSGTVMQWPALDSPVVDKHSTGGIGDKVSLVLAPWLTACGCTVPMISGRGLGHTGGTLDKLDAIPGFSTKLPLDQFQQIVCEIGCGMSGQTPELAPADGRIYAVRDVTATVESPSLITASILSKKLAEGLDHLILDVKHGTGAFMRRYEDARALATNLVQVANGAGVRTQALITDMNQCLGRTAGNALEVREAVAMMRSPNDTDARLLEVTLALCATLLVQTGLARNSDDAREQLMAQLHNGRCAEIFARMVAAQGGPVDFLERSDNYLASAPVVRPVFPDKAGYVASIDGFALGNLIIGLGGGRRIAADIINHAVGLSGVAGIGDAVDHEKPLAIIHAQNAHDADLAETALRAAMRIRSDTLPYSPLIAEVVSPD